MAFSIAPSNSAGQECKVAKEGWRGDPCNLSGPATQTLQLSARGTRSISDKANHADDVRLFS